MAADWDGGLCKRYKTPVKKTREDEAFYEWINRHKNKNRLITKALKALWNLETGRCEEVSNSVSAVVKCNTIKVVQENKQDHKGLVHNTPNVNTSNKASSDLTLPSGSSLKNLTKLIGS